MLLFRMVDDKVHELWSALCDLELVLSPGAVIVLKDHLPPETKPANR